MILYQSGAFAWRLLILAICEAYIAFLENQGDNGTYWRILSDAGIDPV